MKFFTQTSCRKVRHERGAFTLMELLVVLAIMSIVSIVSVPALSGLLSSTGVRSASAQMANMFVLADAMAQAKRTYVYVGMLQLDSQTVLVAIASPGDGSTDVGSAIALQRTVALKGVALASPSTILNTVSLTQAAVTADSYSDSNLGTLQVNYNGTTTPFSYLVQFSPDGMVNVKNGVASRYIQIGLTPANRTGSKDVALVQIAGLTGNVSTFMP